MLLRLQPPVRRARLIAAAALAAAAIAGLLALGARPSWAGLQHPGTTVHRASTLGAPAGVAPAQPPGSEPRVGTTNAGPPAPATASRGSVHVASPSGKAAGPGGSFCGGGSTAGAPKPLCPPP